MVNVNSRKMEPEETILEPPQEFPFPFTAYSIQKDLMHNLYVAIEEKKLGIFESPTGTGKSMSLICASLKWLLDAEKRKKQDLGSNIKKLEEELRKTTLSDNWLDEHAEQAKLKHKKDQYVTYLNKIINKESKIDDIIEKGKNLKENAAVKKKKFIPKEAATGNKENQSSEKEEELVDDDDILLEDVVLDEKLENERFSDSEPEMEKEDEYNTVKIYLCSRTHSQLAQLVGEIQKSPFRDLNIRVVSLASRQNYCINENVLRLKHLPLINERCQDLHQKKKGKTTKNSEKGEKLKRQKISSGCPFYQQTNIDILKAKALTDIQDVEEMVELGKATNACPYYASRVAVEDAQVVVVPYNTILHKSTRLACGINLEDSVVIIDEAHNLLDTISNIHSCIITGHQLACSHSQLVQYKERYHSKFSPFNLLYLNQLIFIVNKLLIKIGGKSNIHPNSATMKPSSTTLETLVEFIFSCEIDTMNLFKILEFTTKSKIVHKLKGYVEKYKPAVVIHKKKEEKGVSAFLKNLSSKKEGEVVKNDKANQKDQPTEAEDLLTGNPLLSVVSFIEALTNHCVDGRIVTTIGTTIGNSSLKFLLLNPAAHFTDIVKQARSVILAGGTMQPMTEFTDQLFFLAGGERSRIFTFSCGHVIPPSNILPIIVSAGPSGKTFDFSYQNRTEAALLDELGRLLVNVSNIIPAGIVCFFPSYEYEQTVFQHFQKTKIIEKLEKKKKVLREPKKSNQVDQVLKLYSKSVEEGGAMLFSVVGGKLSEGLNFSDDLGRCVVVVGLPYPNLTSPELKEKMNYLNTTINSGAGRIYYENLCMKAVNQSIGRSVRHKDDYASVLLIDHRYSRNQCKNALPEWIQKSLRSETKFGPVMESLAKFFAAKKKNKVN